MLLRIALGKKTSKLTAVTAAVALTIAPMPPALAQQNTGPPIIPDTDAEQLLRDYTRRVRFTAGVKQQNLQATILTYTVLPPTHPHSLPPFPTHHPLPQTA